MSENSITPPDGEEPIPQPDNNELAKPAKSKSAKKQAKPAAPKSPPLDTGAGGHTKIWCSVDQISIGTFEVVISRDALGERKASKHIVHAQSATDAVLIRVTHALYALRRKQPLTVTIKTNVLQFVEIRRSGIHRPMRWSHEANQYLWEKFDRATDCAPQVFVEHVTPAQIEATGLSKAQTRELDRYERPFGLTETSPTPNPEVQ